METIKSLLEARLQKALGDVDACDLRIQSTADARFGDYQTNAAMLLAKKRRANPRQIAQQIIEALEVDDCCEKPEIAGAGFINFRLKPEWIASRIAAQAADPKLGVPQPAIPKKWIVDFSSPNVAKPMHVGHIRSTILGDSISRIAEFAGHSVIRDNHIGDWGTQFGMLLLGFKTELNRAALEQDALLEMERIYKLISARCKEDPDVREKARQELVKLQDGNEENLALWNEMQRLSQRQFDEIYGRLDIRFDVTLGESFYNDRLKPIVSELVAKGIARESEGAICVFSNESGPPDQDPFFIKNENGWQPNPAIIQKRDGAANYATTDLATLQYRMEKWAPDEIIYVTDGRQQLHFQQLFAIFNWWMPEAKPRLSHVWFGKILGDDGKPFQTRSGDTIKLAGLLDEAVERAFTLVTEKNPELPESDRREIARVVGLGAVKYADLLPNRQSDYVFSWDRMLALQGNTAPYLQNAYVRIRSIFRKARESGAITADWSNSAVISLHESAELILAKKLLQFGEAVEQVLDDCRPNLLCNYLYELASSFHSFFEACHVMRAETPGLRDSRLALCDLTAETLRKGLHLLGIEAPEKM